MQSHYEVCVSRNGRLFFSTSERSAICPNDVNELMDVFKKKFTKEEGYKISVTFWGVTGRIITLKSEG